MKVLILLKLWPLICQICRRWTALTEDILWTCPFVVLTFIGWDQITQTGVRLLPVACRLLGVSATSSAELNHDVHAEWCVVSCLCCVLKETEASQKHSRKFPFAFVVKAWGDTRKTTSWVLTRGEEKRQVKYLMTPSVVVTVKRNDDCSCLHSVVSQPFD